MSVDISIRAAVITLTRPTRDLHTNTPSQQGRRGSVRPHQDPSHTGSFQHSSTQLSATLPQLHVVWKTLENTEVESERKAKKTLSMPF